MLARIAENIYWLGRYVERVDDMLRLLEVQEETGLTAEVVPTAPMRQWAHPRQLPAPVTIGVYPIERGDPHQRAPHEHIDLVYFTRPLPGTPLDLPENHEAWRWVSAETLRDRATLPGPDGSETPIAEDVRLLGLDAIEAQLRLAGISRVAIDSMWPGVTDSPWISFLIYLVVFDFVDYWLHRAQHGFSWWWALHSLHHSQRQVTVWSDDRNHILDDLLMTLALVVFAQVVGVQPDDYILILMIGRLVDHAFEVVPTGTIRDRADRKSVV